MSDQLPPPDPSAASFPPPSPPSGDAGDPGAYAAPAGPPPAKRNPARLIAGLVAVAVLVIGGVVAAVALSGSDDEGASSPEDAVAAFFDAVDDEDVLGVLATLPPGEREALADSAVDLVDELRRLGVLSDDADLESVQGIDLELEDLTFEVEQVSDDLATVALTGGTASGSYDLSELPLGDTLLDTLLADNPPRGTDQASEPIDADDDPLRLTAVRRDGEWYVSFFYAIAENARQEAGLQPPALGQGVAAEGADSAEDAVRAFFEAAVALDVERLIALTPPDEMAALHDYAPLFLPQVQDAVRDVPFTATVEDLQLETSGDGGATLVEITALSVSLSAEGETLRLAYDGECTTITLPGQPEQRSCADEGEAVLGQLGLGGLMRGDTRSGLRAVEVDGDWYVSPTRSLLGLLVDGLRGFDEDGLRELLQGLSDDPQGFIEDLTRRAEQAAREAQGG